MKLCDWGIGPTKWTMRKLDLGKDFEKESEVDMGTYRGRAFPADSKYKDSKTKARRSLGLAKNEVCLDKEGAERGRWQIVEAL